MSIKRGLRKLANTRLGQAITPPPPATGGVSRRNLGMVAAVGMFGAGQRETNPIITRAGGLTPAPQNAPGATTPAVGVQPGQQVPANIINIGPGRPELVYNPSPGRGNLVLSIAATAGTDPSGNAYLAGFTVYTKVGSAYEALQLLNSDVTFYTATTEAGPWTQEAQEFFGQVLTSPVTDGFNLDNIRVSGVVASTLQLAQGFAVIASNPAAANQITAETWHAMTLLNSWTTGGRVAPQYRQVASPPDTVEIIGSLTAPAGIASGQAIWDLPTGYTVTNPQSVVARNQSTNAAVFMSVTTGSPQTLTYQAGAVSGNVIDFHAFLSQDA